MSCQIVFCLIMNIIAIYGIANLPHGMVMISNINPANPKIVLDEEVSSMIPISVERVGGCKYAAEIGFKCLERSAKLGLDFQCHYKRLTWQDGVKSSVS